MNKQSISFKADEQKLTKTGGIKHYASNIVAYIEATFDLGTNWNGYDSVRAVWSNDYLTDISTVLDPDGKCIVPTEVLADTGNVTVNLVGSIADGDTLTDRLTTYPCKAVIVDADAKVEGEETENITPSQFEQFVEIVHDEVEQVTGMTAEAETLPAGSDATASYADGVLSLGIPRGDTGEQGETGETGDPAGFGDVTASVDNSVGTPSVVVTASGPDTAKDFDFAFHNLKGDKGDTGDTGETGATGNGIASTVLNPDYTLTITFTDGTSYTTPSIRGAKGDTGNTGATGNGIQSTVLNADYTLTITFTDGTSYTTPSIRGEQGPVGPVSDVTVNGTSVVDQNGVAVITMPELVKTVQGNPIVIDDACGTVKNLDVELTPIQDLHGYAKPWSAGAGKNKMPSMRQGSYTYGVATATVDRDGIVTITSTSSSTSMTIPLNTPYTFTTGTKIVLNGTLRGSVRFYDGETQIDYFSVSGSKRIIDESSMSAMINKTCDKIKLYQTTANTAETCTVMILLNSESDDSYSPYSNICPITGHDSVIVTDTGKNLFDKTDFTALNAVWVNANKTIQAGGRNRGFILPVAGGQTYTISIPDKNATDLQVATFADVPTTGSVGLNMATTTTPVTQYTMTISAPAEAKYIFVKYNNLDVTQTHTNDEVLASVQVEIGSTATDYAPYHGQSKTVTMPHTVYGGTVGVVSGAGKVKMVKVTFDGSENWLGYSSTGLNQLYITNNDVKTSAGGVINTVCDAYESISIDNRVNHYNTCFAGTGSIGFNIKDVTAAQWKTMLQNNPITVCYTLVTPSDLSTTPTDISLYNGDNVVSSDGDMELTYVQDMAIVIRKIENQL